MKLLNRYCGYQINDFVVIWHPQKIKLDARKAKARIRGLCPQFTKARPVLWKTLVSML